MLDLMERQRSLTVNQWKIFVACLLSTMMDFFDFFLIGYVLAFVVGGWHLTYGQSAAVLFSSGIAAVPGGWFFGWLGDRIGRRTVFMTTVLIFSLGTGVMALTPEGGWLFLAAMRFVVGLGVGGMPAVDFPLLQEFVPASKRGWISGLSTAMLPAGTLLAASLSAYLGPVIGWRGLFLCGLVPALLAFLIRVWVPESPRWLLRQGRVEEARRSLAWALMVDPATIALPAGAPAAPKPAWLELFRYPRSVAASCLTGLSQTGPAGMSLWTVVLFMMVLKITPAEASKLVILVALCAIAGRFPGAWLSEALGRRLGGSLTCLAAAGAISLAGYLHSAVLGGVSLYLVFVMAHAFFSNASLAISIPYMTELWPLRLKASGFGLAYGTSSLGKFIGPAGLALIAGSSDYVNPKATLAALVPALNYFAFWYILAVAAFLLIGIETRGRSIEELDGALEKRAAPVRVAMS